MYQTVSNIETLLYSDLKYLWLNAYFVVDKKHTTQTDKKMAGYIGYNQSFCLYRLSIQYLPSNKI